ncbi:hypothetical protein DIPPA_20847 [Diplonema papillatum]|nr:hypothetical protein DIPPA_20847 [Diplonema papillatum]
MSVARLFAALRHCVSVPGESLRRYATVPGETDMQGLRKLIYLTYLLAVGFVAAFTALQRLAAQDRDLMFYSCFLLSLWTGCLVMSVLYLKHVSDLNMCTWIVGGVLCLFLSDLDRAAAMMDRPWPFLVLFTDVALVCKLPSKFSTCMVATGVAWLLVTETEAVFRFGLYDVALTDPYSVRRAHCDCSRPPCEKPMDEGASSFVLASLVFVIDFFITRSFAQKLHAEKDKMLASIEAATDVSDLLVQFQLAEAETLLRKCSERGDAGGGQPAISEEFVAVLSNLLSNLKRYEPFLPQSCFMYAEDSPKSPASEHRCSQRISLDPSSASNPTSVDLCRHSVSDEYVRRTVSIVALNVRGLHGLLDSRALGSDTNKLSNNDSRRDIACLQRALLSLTIKTVSSSKGIVDFFMGDRVACSWNASRPCVCHRNMSVLAAYEIGVGLQKSHITTHCGVSSGEALCGNVGTETLRRYNIVGPVYSLAHTIASVARDWEIRLLIDTTVAKDVMTAYEVVAVPEKLTYCKGLTSLPLILWKVEHANQGEEGAEWMYTVQSHEMMQVDFMNTLTLAYLKGQQEEKESLLATQMASEQQPEARRLVEWLQSSPDVATTRLPLVTPSSYDETDRPPPTYLFTEPTKEEV